MRKALASLLIVLNLSATAVASGLKVDRVFVLMRHGVRAPIDGEVPAGTLTARPLPQWPVAAEELTPHGAKAVAVEAKLDRARLAHEGLFARGACPSQSAVRVWTNSVSRTIATGEAYAAAFAPDCGLTVGHKDLGTADPLFEPMRIADFGFDPVKAVASINAYTGGLDALAQRQDAKIRELDKLLDCGNTQGCSPLPSSLLRPSSDGKGLEVNGAISTTSGTAQVLVLLYAEGLVGPRTAWHAISPAALKSVGALHAALFDIFSRSPYMAAYQAGPVSAALVKYINSSDTTDPAFTLLVGHDTNVTALAGLLGLKLTSPGYATGDVAPGGALWIERLTNGRGQHFLRFYYRSQSPQQLRDLAHHASRTRLILPSCTTGPNHTCPVDRFTQIVAEKMEAGK